MTYNNQDYPIRLFVFGTLRKGCRLAFYTDGSKYAGKYYTEGQLMLSETGGAYIDFDVKNSAVIGELYYMNFSALLRIDHLESTSGEFPKAYDLGIEPIWEYTGNNFDFSPEKKSLAFIYKRRNSPVKIKSGDWLLRPDPIKEIKNYLEQNSGKKTDPKDLIFHINKYLKK